MLIDNTVQPGTYYLWIKLTDSPEVVPRLVPDLIQII